MLLGCVQIQKTQCQILVVEATVADCSTQPVQQNENARCPNFEDVFT